MKHVFYIGLGGAAGAVARVLLGHFVSGGGHFPLGTFLANMTGVFVLCYITGLLQNSKRKAPWLDAVTVGVLGGFTTFSAVSMEAVQMLEQGMAGHAAVYIASTIGGGMAAAAAGFYVSGKRVVSP